MRGPGGGTMMAGLVMVETMEVGLQTLSKSALKKGFNLYSFAFYSYAISTLFLLLLFTFHRTTSPPPKLTFSVICKAFVLGLICCCLQFSSLSGIGFASPTLASAMNNLVPAYTFLLAILIRMEKLNLKARSSQAKSIGTIASISGAFVVALYRGPSISFFTSSSSSAPGSSSSRSTKLFDTLLSPPSSWSTGGVVLAVASFLKALLYICQAWTVKAYPAELMLTLISSIFSTIMSGILFLVAENDPNAWKLSSKTELIAVTCTGIYGVAVRGSVHMWALRWKGPIFVAMFKPLGIVIAMVAGVLFLGDKLHLGSILGGAIIAVGFYTVMWGKAREEKVEEDKKKMNSLGVDSSPKALLLPKDEA